MRTSPSTTTTRVRPRLSTCSPAETPDPRGPWDVEDAPEDDIERLDLGGMLVPALPTLELRVEVGPEGQVIAATVAREDSALQINAFAAPRSAGIWDEICRGDS